MASRRAISPRGLSLTPGIHLKFLTDETLPTLFTFPKDIAYKADIQANRLDDQALVKYYRAGWKRFGQ